MTSANPVAPVDLALVKALRVLISLEQTLCSSPRVLGSRAPPLATLTISRAFDQSTFPMSISLL
ncbi:MAG: hypothetical protein M3O46_07535 [Myxococcota bacterium]|nr:hypothetical protein [Myxococcota bacterium]